MSPPSAAARRVALLAALLVTLPQAPAAAHGGLPIAQDLFERDGVLYVPTMFWGVFFGTDGARGAGSARRRSTRAMIACGR